MAKYIVIHGHAHGSSTYLVESDRAPTVRQVVRCLDIDFEPEKGEFIDIGNVSEDEPKTLDWQDSDALEFGEDSDEDGD